MNARGAWRDWLVRKIEATLSPQEQDGFAKAVKPLKRLAEDAGVLIAGEKTDLTCL